MSHVMVDLEMFGTAVDSVILSIGACYFNPDTGQIGQTFHIGLDWNQPGRVTDAHGIRWWFDRPQTTIDKLLSLPQHPLPIALEHFSNFIKWSDPYLWANGAAVDIAMLEHAYGGPELVPWAFWKIRDVRTLAHLAEGVIDKKDIPFVGVEHDALDDAIHQAKYTSEMWQAMKGM
jgi:hypothetical protein